MIILALFMWPYFAFTNFVKKHTKQETGTYKGKWFWK